MEIKGLNDLLAQLRAASALTQGPAATPPGSTPKADFGSALKGALDRVNSVQASSTISALTQSAAATPPGSAPKADFGSALKGALDRVNSVQARSAMLAQNYGMGAANVGIHDVAIASQKANIAFQGTVQVRNKLVAAYNEIMNMQI